jgi:multidrug efflux pump subunit AcrA (membrane-fusion protein)
LAAEHLGRIAQIHVDLGDAVQAGQVLAELDNRELLAEKSVLEAQLSGAQARLDELQTGPRVQEIQQAEALVKQFEATLTLRQANLKRTEDLVKSASISKQEYDEALTGLEATQAQLESSQKTLELLREGTRKEQIQSQEAVVKGLQAQLVKLHVLISELVITAPFAGHVQARLVDEGVIVSPGQPIVEVVETGNLEIHVGVPAHLVNSGALEVARILSGKEALAAELVRVSPTIDHRTRNLEAVFAVQPDSHVLPVSSLNQNHKGYSSSHTQCRIGQAVDVLINIRSDSSGWWIPTSALVPATRGLWSVLIAKATQQDDTGDHSDPQKVGPVTDLSGSDPISGKDSIIHSMQVELLRSSGDWSQIRGAISGSEQLVLSGTHRITSGQRVLAVAATQDEADSLDNIVPGSE